MKRHPKKNWNDYLVLEGGKGSPEGKIRYGEASPEIFGSPVPKFPLKSTAQIEKLRQITAIHLERAYPIWNFRN